MSGKLNLALAVIAMQHGNKDDCLSYMAKAAEFGDDLTSFVSEIIKPPPRAARNDGSTPQAENTLSPSLASTDDFVSLSNRVSRVMALAASLDDGDELDFEPADESFDELELDTGESGVDEDEDDDEEDDEEEATASTAGPIRYKR
ncbi:hypothetical protein D3C71_1081870 [compost metagenome]